MKTITIMIAAAIVLLALALMAAVTFGGPKPIAPLASINEPFNKVDFSDVPAARRFIARDGTSLAWLDYSAAGATTKHRRIVLVHGSSARARSMHVLSKSLAQAGFSVAALDMRGHGDSGPRGQAAYVDQLEDDVADFMRAVPYEGPSTLVGFSSGGGFVLRFSGGKRQDLPRFIALSLLNRVGITAGNHLPVLRFGLDDAIKNQLTSSYSYTLTLAFAPHDDYRGDMRGSHQPMRIVTGSEDELFYGSRYAGVFSDAGKPVPVTLVPGVNHMGLTLDPLAMPAIIDAAGK